MTARSVLSGIVLGLSFSLISPQGAAGQSSTSSTETEVIPEADAHIEMASNWRVLGFSGVQQGVGYDYQQWYAAAALGYQLKPILTPHRENIDPDKEHYFLFGGGYEFLRTTQSGTVKDENRIAIEALVGFRPSSDFLMRDRNRIEFRWVNGAYSTTYRNMPSLERDFLVHGPMPLWRSSMTAQSSHGTRSGTQGVSNGRTSVFSCWTHFTGASTAQPALLRTGMQRE
jgi:hypothetical protein